MPDAQESTEKQRVHSVVGELERVVEDVDAGVVDQNVRWAKNVLSLCHGILHLCHRRDIGLDEVGLVACRVEGSNRCASGLGVDLGHDDAGPLCTETPSDGRADPLARTGDDGNAILESSCHRVNSCSHWICF